MNFFAASTILRQPWLIEEQFATAYLDHYMLNGKFEAQEETYVNKTDFSLASFPENVIVAPTNKYVDFNGFDGATVAAIKIVGPLMKSDFCGSYGTASTLGLFQLAQKTESVKEILFISDSPGGSVDGTKIFADEIKNSSKPVTVYIDGMCCSAAYWIASGANAVYASSSTDMIGSIGTMFQIYDNSKANENRGYILRSYTATASSMKNKAFQQAASGDGKLLIKTLLDPLNDQFIGAIKANRKDVNASALDGSVFVGNDAIKMGLIDGIMPLSELLASFKNKYLSKNNNKFNMAFPKTLKAALATEFKVVDGGFLVNEANLTNLEAVLTDQETKATAAAAKIQEQQTALNAKIESLAKANEELIKSQASVIDLQTKLSAYGRLPGANISVPPGAEGKNDGNPEANLDEQFLTSYDLEMRKKQAASK